MNNKVKLLYSNTVIFAIGNILTKFIMFSNAYLHFVFNNGAVRVAELINNLMEVIVPIATLCISDAVFRFRWMKMPTIWKYSRLHLWSCSRAIYFSCLFV